MDRKEDVEEMRKQLKEALEKSGSGTGEGSTELRNILEALKVLEEQPDIREAWTAEDEQLFQSRGDPRVAHKPNYASQNSNSLSTNQTIKTKVEEQQSKLQIVKETVEWKGIKEKNFIKK